MNEIKDLPSTTVSFFGVSCLILFSSFVKLIRALNQDKGGINMNEIKDLPSILETLSADYNITYGQAYDTWASIEYRIVKREQGIWNGYVLGHRERLQPYIEKVARRYLSIKKVKP